MGCLNMNKKSSKIKIIPLIINIGLPLLISGIITLVIPNIKEVYEPRHPNLSLIHI